MNKERIIENFIEMIKIHSPSKNEKNYTNYLVEKLNELGLEVYLDHGYKNYDGNAPTIFGKLNGKIAGEGVTLAAHTDVVEPSESVNAIIDGHIIKTDETTTLGGDDKAGIASILEVLRVIQEKNVPHKDIFVLLTPCEELGMLGAKNINWNLIPEHMKPAKNMLVIDNAGRAGLIAHTAPTKYDVDLIFKGKTAHAGIEPENGLNAIQLASIAIADMKMGRIDELTTSNIGSIFSNYATNVVAEECIVKAEVRGHSTEKVLEIIKSYEKSCELAIEKFGGKYSLKYICDYPTLKPKDNLKFANEFKEIYKSLGIKSELAVIGGGSDSNILASNGYNSIIIGVGMYNVHTVYETLDTRDLFYTTEAILTYIKKRS
ncbi:M20/M25/M40 family metallo-hydrolase [Psychrilyobacter atlanticus]|uniref:M20/M25/M40 family metallo-hydrolase n=1 Tax=Psychrilyobacter atlanticus TaxID=271091 RepID=UPI000414D9A2|nr:M20/M25/M40 family metallo-hydrolase [Psychrilyobacter atlanticus]